MLCTILVSGFLALGGGTLPAVEESDWPDFSALRNGDLNGDWQRDLSDAIYLLSYLFTSGPAPAPVLRVTDRPGLQNGDLNGDRAVDLGDGIYYLRWLFSGGPEPRPVTWAARMSPGGGSDDDDDNDDAEPGTYVLGDVGLAAFQNAVLPGSIPNDRNVLLGGVGSDLWHDPDGPENEFWMITDRGPNGALTGPTRRTFLVPEFTPAILKVRAAGGVLEILKVIPIRGQSGAPVTGISNVQVPPALGFPLPSPFDEPPFNFNGTVQLPFNPSGLDSEGLVRTSRGDFWICDEYSPSIARINRRGKVVKRYVPAGLNLAADYPVSQSLPAIYLKRRQNRGFEGLALDDEEETLFVALQSPLRNPDAAVGNVSRNCRILVFDIESEQVVAEFVYRFQPANEFPENSPGEVKVSGLVAVDEKHLLVLERTDQQAKLFLVNLANATNILGTVWDNLATAPSLEALADPAAQGIAVLPKRLFLDLDTIANMPDKIEGIALIDEETLAVANDNDFDVGSIDANGNNVGAGLKSRLLILDLEDLDIDDGEEDDEHGDREDRDDEDDD